MIINKKTFLALLISFFVLLVLSSATVLLELKILKQDKANTYKNHLFSDPQIIANYIPPDVSPPPKLPIILPIKPEPAPLPGELHIRVPILMYHHVRDLPITSTEIDKKLSVSPATFEKQLIYFKNKGYKTIKVRDLIDYLSGKKINLPKNPLIFTFDDGYRDFYTVAWPLLKKYNFGATIFLIVGTIGGHAYMTTEMIKSLATDSNIEIGSHTLHHYSLVLIDEKSQKEEIEKSKEELEKITGQSIEIFSYPYGQYNQEIVKLIEEAGYRAALTTHFGSLHTASNLMELRRIRVGEVESVKKLDEKINYILKVNK